MGIKHSRCLKEKFGHEFVARSTKSKKPQHQSQPSSAAVLKKSTYSTMTSDPLNKQGNFNSKCVTLTCQRFPDLFENEDQSDVTFLVGVDSWRFPGHKHVLAPASPVFKAMLNGPLSSTCTKEEIPIEDVEPRAFENVLRFIYIGDVKLPTIQATLDTLYATDKYMIPELTRLCLEVLDFSLSVNNVLVIHHAIRLYSSVWLTSPCSRSTKEDEDQGCHFAEPHYIPVLHTMQNRCLELIDSYADQVLMSDDFENLSPVEVSEIVFRDTLQVNNEGIVFQALHRWATQQCKRNQKEMTSGNKRNSLTNALYGVRYLLMNKEEFVAGPGATDLLTPDEKNWLLATINGSNPPSSSTELVTRKRYLERRRGCPSMTVAEDGKGSQNNHSLFNTLTPSPFIDPWCDPKEKKKRCCISKVFVECFVCFSLFFD